MSDQEQQVRNPDFEIYDNMAPDELVRAMREMEERKEKGEVIMKSVQSHLDFLRLVKIPAVFDDKGLENLRLEGIGRCSLTSDIYASMKADKKEEAKEWLRDNGHEGLLTETVNSSTLKSVMKKAIKEGKPFPDELFNCTPFTRASITKT